tara:strand:+ start:182 stop:397 length:216 start_codon:yes stop_codon:yes gene_type:complete
LKTDLYQAIKSYLQGNIDRHVANVKIQSDNAVGVAEHPDHVATIESELSKIAEFEDKLGVLEKYFKPKEVL